MVGNVGTWAIFSSDKIYQNIYLKRNSAALNTPLCYTHVAADWGNPCGTPTTREKTYLKACCSPFVGNVPFNLETSKTAHRVNTLP